MAYYPGIPTSQRVSTSPSIAETPTEGLQYTAEEAERVPVLPYTTAATDFLNKVGFKDEQKLSEIDYAATDFLSLKNSLINYIKAVYPLDYQNFNESDLALMLIELVSYMGAVMSLKTDMLANENFLATAKSRSSVSKLLSLIGVRMRGPVAAAANAELTLQEALAAEYARMHSSNRTVVTTSPEDGGAVSYTVYKTKDGVVVPANAGSNVTLYKQESVGGRGEVWNNIILVEGAFAVEKGNVLTSIGSVTIPLTQGPVIENSVEVFISTDIDEAAGAYTQVDNIFQSSGSTSKIFEMRRDEVGGGVVFFGDGSTGTAPPINSRYVISYRIGGGTRGNALTNSLNLATVVQDENGARYSGNVYNISQVTGGANAQSVSEAKRYAPLTFARQDRVVTLEDYVNFCSNFVGPFGKIARATAATRKAYCSANIIDVYILEVAGPLQLQRASLSYKNALLEALKPKKMVTDEVVINDGYMATLDLVISIRISRTLKGGEQEIELKVRDKVLDYFNISNRNFGEGFYPTDLIPKLYDIDEVRFATVDNVESPIEIDFNAIIQLNNLVINTIYV